MKNPIHLDLRVSRRKSGLSQADCAHLLGVGVKRLSKLETGACVPRPEELYLLSMIYSKDLASFFDPVAYNLQVALIDRLRVMPKAPKRWTGRYNRVHTLQALALRLEVLSKQDYGPSA